MHSCIIIIREAIQQFICNQNTNANQSYVQGANLQIDKNNYR